MKYGLNPYMKPSSVYIKIRRAKVLNGNLVILTFDVWNMQDCLS